MKNSQFYKIMLFLSFCHLNPSIIEEFNLSVKSEKEMDFFMVPAWLW